MNLDDAIDNRTAFIDRLIEAGWSREDAEQEWGNIQDDTEGEL